MNWKQAFIGLAWVLTMELGCKEPESPPQPAPSNPWDTVTQYSGIIVPGKGSITFQVSHLYDGAPIEFATRNYTNAAGDTFNIRELKHYLTNITLTKTNGDLVNLGNFQLLDAKEPTTQTFTLNNVPEGNYKAMSFLLAVDSFHNHNGPQEGALDPSWGMFWTWSTGYVFYRINGTVSDGKSYSFDLGGDSNAPMVSIDLQSYKVKSLNLKMQLDMEVNEMYQSPALYSFKTDGLAIHDDKDPAGYKLAKNMEDMVKIKTITP